MFRPRSLRATLTLWHMSALLIVLHCLCRRRVSCSSGAICRPRSMSGFGTISEWAAAMADVNESDRIVEPIGELDSRIERAYQSTEHVDWDVEVRMANHRACIAHVDSFRRQRCARRSVPLQPDMRTFDVRLVAGRST